MAKSRSKKVVKGHGRPKRKDGKPYRGTCRKCGKDHSTSAHWSHAKGPKAKGPRGGSSYRATRGTGGMLPDTDRLRLRKGRKKAKRSKK